MNSKDNNDKQLKAVIDRLDRIEGKIDNYMEFSKTYVDSQLNLFRTRANYEHKPGYSRKLFAFNNLEVPESFWLIVALGLVFWVSVNQ